jgi:hypothetical protein
MKWDKVRVQKALTAAYHEKEKVEVGDLWQIGVMHRARSLGPLNSKIDYLELLERFVWRFAPVACLLIVVLAMVLANLDFVSDYEIAKAFMEDPLDFSLFQFLQAS